MKQTGVGNLFEGKLTIDKTYGYAAYGCAVQCCWYDPTINPNPFTSPVGTGGQDTAWSECSANWLLYDVMSNTNPWSSTNTSVATLSGLGYVNLVGAGSSTINTSIYLDSILKPYCKPYLRPGSGGANGKPNITAISPGYIKMGDSNVQVTISGSGFSSVPTVTLPSGLNYSLQGYTPTSIVISITATLNATAGPNNLTVTVNGQVSSPKTLAIEIPSKMMVRADQWGLCSGCSATVQRLVRYQVLSLNEIWPNIQVAEQPVYTSWSCSQNWPGANTTSCTDNAYTDSVGEFLDLWTLGSDGYSPSGCGTAIQDPWFWCAPPNRPPFGFLSGWIHTNNTNINSYTNPPNRMPNGLVINPQ